MRLFAAVRLTDERKDSLIHMMNECRMRGVEDRYTSAENLHLTLCFN